MDKYHLLIAGLVTGLSLSCLGINVFQNSTRIVLADINALLGNNSVTQFISANAIKFLNIMSFIGVILIIYFSIRVIISMIKIK